MRAGAGLDADDPLGVQQAGEGRPDMLGVFLGEDVIGDHNRTMARGQQHRDKRLD